MKPRAFEYVAANTLDDALAALASGDEDVRILAGGQTLVPVMNFRLATPSILIDLNGIASLSGIGVEADGGLRLGAMTRHRMVEKSNIVRTHMPLLHAAMPYIAHVQIRNRGTIGGSLAHCDPAAEWPALCLALDARIAVTSQGRGRRVLRTEDFAQGLLTTALQPDEILTDVYFPAQPPGRRYGFEEVARRHGDFALAGVACAVDLDDNEKVVASRIVVFGVEDRSVLLDSVSAFLAGRNLTPAVLQEAGKLAVELVSPRGDFHASEIYRRELVDVMLRRALTQTVRAGSAREAA